MQNALITSLVTGFGLALPFGYVAERFLKTPALVGYILAGVAVGVIPGLPAVNAGMIEQLADIGIMLLMFGVGLHFSVRDLLNVKGLVIPGAAIQMTAAAALGAALARGFWGWGWGGAVLFGFTISCASTVVVTKALEIRRMTNEIEGRAAIGWLVMQDLVSVVLLVCLPPFAQAVGGAEVSAGAVTLQIAKTLAWAAVFVALMMLVGRKAMPLVLREAALTGSRELFTLSVLGCAIVIAYGAGAIFDVSFALGAFFAGMVMQESRYAHRAATESLPLQDAFSVLFFVSVGMMLDAHVFLDRPWEILAVVLVIAAGEMIIAATVVTLLRWPLGTAFTLGACLGQIGEFSFILAAQGISLKLVDGSMMSLIVAASIVTIALNPILFELAPKLQRFCTSRWAWARRANMRPAPFGALPEDAPAEMRDGQIVVVGEPEDGRRAFFRSLAKAGRRTIVICGPKSSVKLFNELGFGVLFGDAADAEVLVQAHLRTAGVLVIPSGSAASAIAVVETARRINRELPVVFLAKNADEAALFDGSDKHLKVLCAPLLTSLTVSAVALEALFADEEQAGDGEASRRTVRTLVDDEYRRSVAAARTGGAEAGEPGAEAVEAPEAAGRAGHEELCDAAVTMAEEAIEAARRQRDEDNPPIEESAKGWGRIAAGLLARADGRRPGDAVDFAPLERAEAERAERAARGEAEEGPARAGVWATIGEHLRDTASKFGRGAKDRVKDAVKAGAKAVRGNGTAPDAAEVPAEPERAPERPADSASADEPKAPAAEPRSEAPAEAPKAEANEPKAP